MYNYLNFKQVLYNCKIVPMDNGSTTIMTTHEEPWIELQKNNSILLLTFIEKISLNNMQFQMSINSLKESKNFENFIMYQHKTIK